MKTALMFAQLFLAFALAVVSTSRVAWGQAAYVRDYHWIYGKGVAKLGPAQDSKGFLEGNETGAIYGYQTVKKLGPEPQKAVLTFRSLSLAGTKSGNGYCWGESIFDGVDAIGSIGGGIAAKCDFSNAGHGSFMSAWDFEETTFHYDLRCAIPAICLDGGTTLSVRYGVGEYKHGLKAVFDAEDDEWNLFGWQWQNSQYAWVPLPNTVKSLNYSLTGHGGPIGWGQLAVAENLVDFACTGINFGVVVNGEFRASVVAQ